MTKLIVSMSVSVGGGTRLLPEVIEPVELTLVETRAFGGRVIYERYQRARPVA